MEYRKIPHFIIKANLQKSNITGLYFKDVVTPNILSDVCYQITGQYEFTYNYVDNDYCDDFLEKTYNKGRMAIMLYRDEVNYISFSELEIGGRNSSIQSVPTAFNMFYMSRYNKKKIFYYFLNQTEKSETEYQIWIYRLMSTIGFHFLNVSPFLTHRINSFTSVDDIIFNRKLNANKNRSNNSTFITKSPKGEIEIFGKTYGANKYETSLICYAVSMLCKSKEHITLYEMNEQDLKELPLSSRNVIKQMGNITVVATDKRLERHIYEGGYKNMRSPRYLYNLLTKLGDKKCALCNCEIPELIQGAHILPVAAIKSLPLTSAEEGLKLATDGDNGLWLCANHHKLFDEGLIYFDKCGSVFLQENLSLNYRDYILSITTKNYLEAPVLTGNFLWYLEERRRLFFNKFSVF